MKTNLLSITLLIAVFSTSCTSFKPVSKSSDYTTLLKRGNMTQITLSDSSRIDKFKIKQVLADTLKGTVVAYVKDGSLIYKDKAIPTADIIMIKQRKFNAGKTLALTGGIVISIYGLAWISFSSGTVLDFQL